MKITDLSHDNKDIIQQVAQVLVEGFQTHWPNAWPDLEYARSEVQESFGADRINRVAVSVDGKVLGWIAAIREYDGHSWELHPLVVLPDHQGSGIGRALVNDLENLVRQRRRTPYSWALMTKTA
jgi:aminoglycoside 6'-N-acetyltransferase I